LGGNSPLASRSSRQPQRNPNGSLRETTLGDALMT
jgi:hypothetical protein